MALTRVPELEAEAASSGNMLSHCAEGCCGKAAGAEEAGNAGHSTVLERRNFHIIHNNFETVILLCITTNSLFMLTEHHSQPDSWTRVLEIQNAVFCVVFTIEAIVKLIGLSVVYYFRDPWNCFDFVVVTLSWPTMMMGQSSGSVLRLIRILRLCRYQTPV